MFFFINKRFINIQRNYNSNSANINVLTNKEINRKKKQQTWMKKINAKEIPRKKYGNKLGTVAKQLYLLPDLKGNPINGNICDPSDKTSAKIKLDNYDFRDFFGKNNEPCANNNNNKNSIEMASEKMSSYENSKLQWDEICDELKYHLPFLQPYSISMSLNYLSKINYNEYDIFKLVAEQLDERWLKNFNIKDLCQLLLSYSRINSKFYAFINLISKELLYKICYSDFEDLSLIAYAYTKLRMYDFEVFLHICNETKHKIKDEIKNSQLKKGDNVNENGKLKIIQNDTTHVYDYDVNCGSEQNKVLNVNKNKFDIEYNNKNDEKSEFNKIRISNKLSLIKSDIEINRIDMPDDKKYSYLCLLVYCLGKNKHHDNILLNLIVEYIDLKIVNNIDLSNLAYGFSVFNIYNGYLYESLCKKIYEDLNKIESLQKIIIMGYFLKYPQYKMLDLYYIFLININEEIKESKKKIYKEVVFLNMCINSFSCDKFLNIIFNSSSKEYCENDKVKKLFFLYNFLISYVDYFMKNKNIDSRDYPKILTILFKIVYFDGSKISNISESNQEKFIFLENYKKHVDIHKATLLVNLALDNIIKEINKLHKYDLNNVKNILNICMQKKDINNEFNFVQKTKAILSSF
ncbi:conserved Plasmodium protein, unknown function [Plasmodium berghei]|uniref:Heptatricopeptide repeat-containing protein, putative n=3 Tax=Plasmodium berghei TaxID=5821 RepID=A0A509ALB1_PLABA|nr:heptatricopeptide repeat-containing protein, putative [Plasmodium berghei ANKA]CXI40402.1 conserved Plasmodium protein, unknown function [Plasmodium berghei]SCM21808.1 conserved Plasmodium protein, unknown function [Plasmodium berghei]SCN25056.1 conserved Plasmodium protein, unknown function [Plasmodium berghei]SCO60087.1 conserved Plasmodium protein, unknown function [Plasmodium berghei]VUC55611.1 heptatricopeptide repeat-containing protein, putative [Plasmodium berghei ANKA]|eukprot:XP_034421421.1 heptatricopeptide repeat-containing protein, putative [Plasmodium berghei ANKA]